MKSAYLLHFSAQFRAFNPNRTSSSSTTLAQLCKFNSVSLASPPKPSRLITLSASNSDKASSSSSSNSESVAVESIREGLLQFQDDPSQSQWNVEVGNPNVPSPAVAKLSLSDQAFFLLAFVACTVWAQLRSCICVNWFVILLWTLGSICKILNSMMTLKIVFLSENKLIFS